MMKNRVLAHKDPGQSVEDYLRYLVNELNQDQDPDPIEPVSSLEELSDVEITSVADGQFLRYDAGTGKWINVTLPVWSDAEFLVAAADANLPNHRLVQDTATIKWDFSVFGFAEASLDQTALDVFTGDTGSGGLKGLVPAPSAGDAAADKYLHADGTFRTLPAQSGRMTFNDYNLGAVAVSTNYEYAHGLGAPPPIFKFFIIRVGTTQHNYQNGDVVDVLSLSLSSPPSIYANNTVVGMRTDNSFMQILERNGNSYQNVATGTLQWEVFVRIFTFL